MCREISVLIRYKDEGATTISSNMMEIEIRGFESISGFIKEIIDHNDNEI